MIPTLFSVSYAGIWGQLQLDIESFIKKAAALGYAAVELRAKRHGVCLGVQNHHDTGVSTDAFIEFLNEVDHPNCKAMFDPWAPAMQGENLYECARALAPRMAQTTIADYVRLKRWAYMPHLVNYRPMPAMVRAVPLGQGFIDFGSFFKGLREGGFEGPVAYEMCSPLRGGGSLANLDRSAEISLNQIRALINPPVSP